MIKNKFAAAFKGFSLRNILFLTVAGVVNAVGVTMFLTPVSLYDGGFSGTSFFLSQYTPLALSIWLVILNFPFYIFAYRKLNFLFIVYSLWAIGMYSLWAYLFQNIFPINYSNGSPIAGNDLLLCAIFGGMISGCGSGIVIRFGGAIDGVEVTAVLFAKKLGLSVGTFVMIYNAIIYIIAGILSQTWQLALYSIVAYAVGLKAVDFVIEGFDRAKSAFIITNNANEVADALSEEFGRGVTVMDAYGYYSQKNKAVVYCVVNRFEVSRLKKLVADVDENAFVAINDVSDSISSNLRFNESITRARKNKHKKSKIYATVDISNNFNLSDIDSSGEMPPQPEEAETAETEVAADAALQDAPADEDKA